MVGANVTSERDKAVREHLEQVLASPGFTAADRRKRLLRFLIDRALADDGASLKESVIAIEVFDCAPGYDPKLDSSVRVEMGRLRSRLVEYYAGAGAGAAVRIEIPRGSYRPVFTFADSPDEAAPLPEPSTARFSWRPVAIIAGSLALAVACFAVWKIGARGTDTPGSVAVLPFLNLSGDPANEYLGDSMADEVTGMLAEAKDLRVVARTSAFQFKGKAADIRRIGSTLGAGAVLEGSLSKQSGQYRIVVQLIRSSDGYHLWSHGYDANATDLQRVEDEIAHSTLQVLSPASRDAASPVRQMTTSSPEAHDLYLRAKYYLAVRTPEALRTSVTLAKRAIEKDPSYPLPWEDIGTAEWVLGTLTAQPEKEAEDRAIDALDHAIALNPGFGDAHALRAGIVYNRDWDWPRAEAEFRLALEQSSSKAHSLYGWGLATRGRFREAQSHLKIAEELDPLGAGPLQNRAGAYYMAHDYPRARRELARWLELDPHALYALLLLSAVDLFDNKCSDAQATGRKMAELYPALPISQGTLVMGAARCGQPQAARQFLDGVEKSGATGVARVYLASLYAALHDADHTFRYLNEAVIRHESQLLWLKFDPGYDEFHKDSRFLELERRVGLPD
jgi:TolB-like protein/Tfp pilus assembly protein PilF